MVFLQAIVMVRVWGRLIVVGTTLQQISTGKGCLVGGWATPLKNMKVNWDDDIPNIWENKKIQTTNQMCKD